MFRMPYGEKMDGMRNNGCILTRNTEKRQQG